MSLYFITGVTGTGKSTIREALVKLGYEAYDTDDDGIATFYNKSTGKVEDRPKLVPERTEVWYAQHEWRMNAPAMKRLALKAKTKTVFLCGVTSNSDAFQGMFTKVFCLTLGWDKLENRILTRTNNEFGKAPDELKSIHGWHQYFEDKNRENGAAMIDASQPIEQVVSQILAAI